MDDAEICNSTKCPQGYHIGDSLECDNELSARRCIFEHFKETVNLFQQCKVIEARRALIIAHRKLVERKWDSVCNPTDYEKEEVKRGREIFLRRISAPPFLGTILLDQPISDKADHFYASFTNVFAAVALKLHRYDIAIEVFQLSVTYYTANASPRPEVNKGDLNFIVGVIKNNVGCVYLIMRDLDKAKENLECTLEIFERHKMKTNNKVVEINIAAALNNLSLVLQGQKNYPAAINIQKSLLAKANDPNLPVQMVAAIHYNRSELFLELKEPSKALIELEKLDSLSGNTNDEDGILEKFISSKICLAYQMTGKADLADEIAERLINFYLFPESSPLPSSSSSTSLASPSSSSSSSSASSSLSSLSFSSPASSSLFSLFSFSSSNFEDFLKCSEKLSWDFLFAMIENLVDFYLSQENLELVSFLDVFVSGCKITFGKDHPTFATFLNRQGVRLFLMEENVSSKNCFEEALSIFTSLHLSPTHPEMLKSNVALARLLSCENFPEDQPTTGLTQTAYEEPCRETNVFVFSNTSTSSSVFRKLAIQIINHEEEIGKFSEVVLKNNLLKLRGPSIGQVTVWPQNERIKIKIQLRHGIRKENSEANSQELEPCNCSVVVKIFVEEMKLCVSSLGISLKTFTEESLCNLLQPSSIPTVLLPNLVGESEGRPSPASSSVTLKREREEPLLESLDLNLVEIGSQQVLLLKPCFVEDWEDFRCDVTDGVANSSIPLFRDVIDEQDHDEDLERGELQISGQENRKVDRPKNSHKTGRIRGNNMPQTTMERPNLAAGGNNPDDLTINEAYGFQEHWNTLTGEISRKGKDAHDNYSRIKESLGLKGGRPDECPVSYNAKGFPSVDDFESNQFGICSNFLASHSDEYTTSLTYDTSLDEDEERPSDILSMYNKFGCFPEKEYHTLQGPSTCREWPDFTECSARDHPAYTTRMGSSAQTYSNPSRYHPQQPFLNLVLTPKNGEVKNQKPPPSSSLHYQESGKNLGLTGSDVYTGSVQSRLFPNVSTNVDAISQTPTSSSQPDTEKEAPGILSSEEDEELRLVLLDSNSNTSDEESLAVLERRVAEACSLVERTLKEREEKGKAIQERERRQREERLKKQKEERKKWEREAWEAVHWSDGEEAMETMQRSEVGKIILTKGEETPAQPASIPENPQWLCEHYQRLCRVKFPCCGRFYPCHRCHNNSGCGNDNSKAKEAFYIECSVCGHQQEINRDAQACAKCKTKFSAYFCSICKHFTGESKNPYHCTKCGICRIYKDRSFHCDVCNVCLDKRLQGKHKCKPNSGHDECCICLEDAFSGCQILPCSHKVHRECAIAMVQNGVRSCPICRYPLYSQTGGTE